MTVAGWGGTGYYEFAARAAARAGPFNFQGYPEDVFVGFCSIIDFIRRMRVLGCASIAGLLAWSICQMQATCSLSVMQIIYVESTQATIT